MGEGEGVSAGATGEFQSPINIDSRGATFDAELPTNLHWSGEAVEPVKLINTGHGFQVQMKGSEISVLDAPSNLPRTPTAR